MVYALELPIQGARWTRLWNTSSISFYMDMASVHKKNKQPIRHIKYQSIRQNINRNPLEEIRKSTSQISHPAPANLVATLNGQCTQSIFSYIYPCRRTFRVVVMTQKKKKTPPNSCRTSCTFVCDWNVFQGQALFLCLSLFLLHLLDGLRCKLLPE